MLRAKTTQNHERDHRVVRSPPLQVLKMVRGTVVLLDEWPGAVMLEETGRIMSIRGEWEEEVRCYLFGKEDSSGSYQTLRYVVSSP